ncbi:MAG: hypothetical protein ACKORD_04930, partial [Acidimicrobiaceae bacterium]
MTTKPSSPIEFSDSIENVTDRIDTVATRLPSEFLGSLEKVCPSSTSTTDLVEHARDWWPLAMHWALNAMTTR